MTKSLKAEKAKWLTKAPVALSLTHVGPNDPFTAEQHLVHIAKLILHVFTSNVGDETYDIVNDELTTWVE